MFTKLGRGLLTAFRRDREDTPLVTMFRTEYGKEYRHARKFDVVINDRFVKEFLANQ